MSNCARCTATLVNYKSKATVQWCEECATLLLPMAISSLVMAQATLNPLSGYTKKGNVKLQKHLLQVRDEIRRTLKESNPHEKP